MAHHSQRPFQRLRLAVLERDQWICQMPHCRYPTRTIPRSGLRPMHPMSASIDMITPKSLNGSDEDLNNLRAAHLGCNSARGNGTHTNKRRQRYGTSQPRIANTQSAHPGGRGAIVINNRSETRSLSIFLSPKWG